MDQIEFLRARVNALEKENKDLRDKIRFLKAQNEIYQEDREYNLYI